MVGSKIRIENALNEARILILGAQILVGLLYRGIFEPDFKLLPGISQLSVLAALLLILFAFGLFMSPVSYHQVIESGATWEDLRQFVTRVMRIALLPFALSLGLTIYVAGAKVEGFPEGLTLGLGACILELLLWYGLGWVRGRTSSLQHLREDLPSVLELERTMNAEDERTELKDKIGQVLTEARMVLPGTQALMGFQFVIILMDDFDKLSRFLKQVHLLALVLCTISTILLMAPAAYHRLVERGEETQDFYRLASRLVLSAMVPLAAGICADYYVVASKITSAPVFALVSALMLLVFFYGLWFGLTAYRRRNPRRTA